METPITFVILAAGLGTRMKSRRAKVLHRAGGKALVEHVVDTALELTSPERIFVVVGHQAEEVRTTVGRPGIGFIRQHEQKGTGHAVMIGRERLAHLDGCLVVLYGDCPLVRAATLGRLIDAQRGTPAAAGTILTAEMDDPRGYGRVLRDARGRVYGVVEQKAGTAEQLANLMAVFCILSWRVLWLTMLARTTPEVSPSVALTDSEIVLQLRVHVVEGRIADVDLRDSMSDRIPPHDVVTVP